MRKELYIPVNRVFQIEQFDSADDWVARKTCECATIEDTARFLKSFQPLLAYFPLYLLTVIGENQKFVSYIIDPSEHEHMERYLAGTDDPMYDFVHELRNNPRALPPSAELAEATERHNKRNKKNEEGSQ